MGFVPGTILQSLSGWQAPGRMMVKQKGLGKL